jgi:hypothetical protein
MFSRSDDFPLQKQVEHNSGKLAQNQRPRHRRQRHDARHLSKVFFVVKIMRPFLPVMLITIQCFPSLHLQLRRVGAT